MKSILEIAIAAQEQKEATDEELRLALVSYSHMLSFAELELRELCDAVVEGKPSVKLRAECVRNELDTRFKARKMTPTEYLGKEFTPGTAEHDKLRKMAFNVVKKATGIDLEKP